MRGRWGVHQRFGQSHSSETPKLKKPRTGCCLSWGEEWEESTQRFQRGRQANERRPRSAARQPQSMGIVIAGAASVAADAAAAAVAKHTSEENSDPTVKCAPALESVGAPDERESRHAGREVALAKTSSFSWFGSVRYELAQDPVWSHRVE